MKQIAGPAASPGLTRGFLASGGAGSPPPEQALFQPELARSLRMHPWLALMVALAGMALSVVYFFRLWPIYEASTIVYVQPMAPSVMSQYNPIHWPMDGSTYDSFIQQKITDVTRPDVLAVALRKIPAGLWQKGGESDQSAAERLSHTLQIQRSGSYQISISARSSKPMVAAQLANAVTNAYLETAARDFRPADAQRLAILREEHDRVQDELNADRTEQAALSRQLGIAAPAATAPDLLDEQISRARTELMRARTEHDEAAARFAAMNSSSGDASSAIDAQADEIASSDQGLISMKGALYQRRALLSSQMANLTPNHPLYKQDAAELEKINAELDASARDLRSKAAARIQQKLRSDLQRTAEVEAKLNGELRSAVGTAASATVKIQRSNDLAADISRLQSRFAIVDEQLHNLMLDSTAPGSVSLVAAAVPPLHPVRSGVFRNTFILMGASIVFGMLIAVLAHKFDARIYIASDIEHILGFAPMAQLPDFDEVPEAVAAQFLFRLAGDIGHVLSQDNIHEIALTGASEGVGVSTLASRLRSLLVPAEAPVEPLVLAEAAPLTLSADAENLIRHAGWTLAVVESGVTTRSQLRALAAALQRLDVPAVGFILNRVRLSKADPAFRRSVREAERHLRRRGSSDLPHRLLVRPQPEVAARAQENLPPAAALSPSLAAPAPEQEEPLAPPTLSSLAAVPPPPAQPEPQPEADPWWLADLAPAAPRRTPAPVVPSRQAVSPVPPAPRSAVAETEPVRPAVPEPRPAVSVEAPRVTEPMPQSFVPATEPIPVSVPEPVPATPAPPVSMPSAAEAQPSRLGGLRDVLFRHGFKSARRTAVPADAPASFPDLAREPRQSMPPAPPAATVSSRPAEVHFVPSKRQVMAEPEILPPPREYIPIRDDTAQDEVDDNEDIDILPSRHGQYRRR